MHGRVSGRLLAKIHLSLFIKMTQNWGGLKNVQKNGPWCMYDFQTNDGPYVHKPRRQTLIFNKSPPPKSRRQK